MKEQQNPVTIVSASADDAQALADLFIGHITAHPEYISHGEIQMSVGEGFFRDGRFVARPAPDAREKWIKCILLQMSDDSVSHVWKAVDDNGNLMGFCVAVIEGDMDAPFGMVDDILVNPQCRGGGVGNTLLQTAIAWFHSKGIHDIFLESGKDNLSAHRYFEKRGFFHVSNMYKLTK